ncbi:unnamed protein product [Fraxinus pennsylvanica]|uniref:Micronuclear linker histone polyprotein-like protein n=1 Tax=Fraxinus pennsylvanica TaxID=56036 RepID=A0AAD1YPT9_9LAMI|nr:unnamed protein product [Fraxinus pennsylvanica]
MVRDNVFKHNFLSSRLHHSDESIFLVQHGRALNKTSITPLFAREREREMGGGMKGHSGYNSRTRSYMLMLLLAFGAAIFGVMLLHKLRERRIFNLLAEQKDQKIFSLQLLLQKEREQAQGAKTKMEEMKAKIYNLRTQKTKLNGRLSEMQSTISSLKDEQKALELAFQEMQNEAKIFKQKYGEVSDQNPQVIALSEILRQKEAEIEDLKRRLESHVKVWSVSTDDPSNSSVNLTAGTNLSTSGEIKVNDIQDENGNMHESINHAERQNSTNDASNHRDQDEKRTENGMLVDVTRERTEEDKSEKIKGSQESGFGYGKIDVGKRNDPKDAANNQNEENSLQMGEKRKGENDTETTSEEQKPRNENSELQSTDGKELGTLADFGLSRRIPDFQGGENEESSVNHKGGMKLEMKRNSNNGRYTLREKHGHLKRTKGKRWRTIIKHHIESEDSDSDGAMQRKPDENQDINTSFRMESESTLEHGNTMLPDHVKPIDSEDMSQKVVNLTRSEDSRLFNQHELEKTEQNVQSREQDTTIQQHDGRDDYEVDKKSGQKEVAEKNDVKMEDVEETRSEMSTSTESTSSLEEESEEQKYEPEF